MRSTQDIFNSLAPELHNAVTAAGGGLRTIHREEPFFPTQKIAEDWASAQQYQGGYIVGVIVVLVLPDGERIGLTTTAQHKRAHEQALAYMQAHSKCAESKGVMFEAWEVGFLPDSYN